MAERAEDDKNKARDWRSDMINIVPGTHTLATLRRKSENRRIDHPLCSMMVYFTPPFLCKCIYIIWANCVSYSF